MKSATEMFIAEIGSRGKFKILTALLDKPMSVNQISDATGLEQTHVSHNLKSLLTCRFVQKKVISNMHEYRLDDEIRPLIKGIVNYVRKYERFLFKCGVISKRRKHGL